MSFKRGACFLLVFTFFIPARLFSQADYITRTIGIGSSSLTGFSAIFTFSLEKKHNALTFRGNINSETGNYRRAPAFFFTSQGPKHKYNDIFLDAALLVGRTFRYRNRFLFSSSLGPAYFKYTDKGIGVPSASSGPYGIYAQEYSGVGLGLQSELLFNMNENLAIGLTGFGNYNKIKPIYGVTLSLAIVVK